MGTRDSNLFPVKDWCKRLKERFFLNDASVTSGRSLKLIITAKEGFIQVSWHADGALYSKSYDFEYKGKPEAPS